MKNSVSRRNFLGGAASAGAGLALGLSSSSAAEKPAAPAADAAVTAKRMKKAADWPLWDNHDEQALLDVLHSGAWGRTGNGGARVKEFEALFAKRMGAKHCIAVSSGTTALLSTLGALNIGPGDEVILPPYTFVATFNAITSHYALPVFADVDLDTFQLAPAKVSAALTYDTALLLPVHIGGNVVELDQIADLARTRHIPMVEDACQALTAEWGGKPVGTKGTAGCFSFQASKNLTAGEGGAVVTNDEAFADKVFAFHTPNGGKAGTPSWGRAANYRLTEFQAGLLLAQYGRFEAQQTTRTENATYLSTMLGKIAGITPAKLTSGCNRSGWHLYMFRYDAKQFAGLSRTKFLQALAKEGIVASGGYTSLNHSPHVKALAENPHYQKIYGKEKMAAWVDRNQCPVNDRLIQEAVWFTQTKLLSPRAEMERIAEVIAGVHKRAGDLAKA